MKSISFIVLIICCLSCKNADFISRPVTWETIQVSGGQPLFTIGSEVLFAVDTIYISTDKQVKGYKMVLTDNRLVIESNNEKFLYQTELLADSLMVLTEMYTTYEVSIKLRKSDIKK